jgi:hypothetical protein
MQRRTLRRASKPASHRSSRQPRSLERQKPVGQRFCQDTIYYAMLSSFLTTLPQKLAETHTNLTPTPPSAQAAALRSKLSDLGALSERVLDTDDGRALIAGVSELADELPGMLGMIDAGPERSRSHTPGR